MQRIYSYILGFFVIAEIFSINAYKIFVIVCTFCCQTVRGRGASHGAQGPSIYKIPIKIHLLHRGGKLRG